MDASHLKTGRIGEEIACRFMRNRGFTVIERNYRKKYGEIDIICMKNQIIHFVEVKSTASENINQYNNEYSPAEHVHERKIRRLKKVMETYLFDRYQTTDINCRLDIIVVYISKVSKEARIIFMENIITD